MKKYFLKAASHAIALFLALLAFSHSRAADDPYPSVELSNDTVKMKVYLPDAEKGFYRGTRFDWSGMIGIVQYKGHEFFGFWRHVPHDPMAPTGVVGPSDTYREAGLGYDEAKVGEGFLRIGVGSLKKKDEPVYDYHYDYELLDYGEWSIEKGADWIEFTHEIEGNYGYGYSYKKTIRLNESGFDVRHDLLNTGSKRIDTDQYSHNFITIDNERAGPSTKITYPYPITPDGGRPGPLVVKGDSVSFSEALEEGAANLPLKGFSDNPSDNSVKVENTSSGAGISVSVDRRLEKQGFWTNGLALCPENETRIAAEPGETETWTSRYKLFAK